jgi:hypothetical protein
VGEHYRVHVRGHLDDRWCAVFDSQALSRREDGTTELVCAGPDQAALHAVIARIRDLGLTLVSVSLQSDAASAGPPQPGAEVHETARERER